ncbi:choline dehydrogenase [Rhodobacteraceae bacterium CCMM004]|nr:choline dehydrogenase [Rhodobacteraceae bacterium CCMM004]
MQADYVIVGAGSAGCAIAYRLAEAGRSVVVVEHGGSDAGPLINMPGALSFPMNMARYDWGYRSEPEPNLGGRRMAVPRGKVIGGSSSVNGMVYVRGHARDFDTWAQMGARGWSYADVLPYFRRMETWHPDAAGGDTSWRGTDGPLHVTRARADNPLTRAFVEAGRQAGYPVTPDYNGAAQEGVGTWDATIRGGRRWSAASAYLRPARRMGARVVRGLVTRVIVEGGRATGVEIRRRGRRDVVRAGREVILAASAINSPKLLMLSGIGPGERLRDLGIAVQADRPGVGANLQDHLELYVQMSATAPVSLYAHWSLWGKAMVGARWLLGRRGPGASNQFEAGAFLRSRAGIEYPDLQIHFLPIAVRYDGRMVADGHGYQAHVGPMRSKSRGAVTLKRPDPEAAPEIRFNYMSHPDDWAEFRTGIRLVREICAQPALARFTGGEILPGAGIESDAALDDAIRDHAESAYHPCGTCRMGAAEDRGAVVDAHCRVIGVDGLRVADSSIFPQITNGNLNAPSIMVGEKAADHILGRAPLPRDDRAPVLNEQWAVAQR